MTDWESWQKHVDYVIETQGRWYGLGDGDGAPLFDLPAVSSMGAPEQWMSAEDVECEMPAVDADGVLHRAAEILLMDSIAGFDSSGQLPPATEEYTLLMVMRGPDGKVERRGGIITHVDGTDPNSVGIPQTMTIHALNFMDVWNTIPASSWPTAWWKATPYPRSFDESGLAYPQPWDMARVEMATHLTFTFKQGRAGFVIRRLAQESLDAAMMTQQDPGGVRWVDDPYHVVEVPAVDNSPEISLEARDGSLWDTVAGQAKNAGVLLGCRLWWPGDAPIRSWQLATSSMTPEQVDISPMEGEPYRQVVEQEFPHAMLVLTAEEVS